MTPLRRAALIAGAYVLLAGAWILGSGAVVAQLAQSQADVERLERFKGLFFVFGTGGLLFVAAYLVIKRLVDELERTAQAREAMLELERKSLAGLFVSSIAHDANNVAMVVQASLDHLEQEPVSESAREAVADANEAIDGLVKLFRDVKDLGRGERTTAPVETDLVEAATRTLELLRGHSLVKHCRARVVAEGPVRARVFPVLVDQALINLIINGADATHGRGALEVRVRREGDVALLEVHDDGPGVPADVEPRLFTPFQTSKPHGTGLGLVSVKECAARHGGSVSYARSPLGGACFTVRVPLGGPA